MRARVQINEDGEFFLLIPEDVVAQYNLDDGDLLEWDVDDEELIILSIA